MGIRSSDSQRVSGKQYFEHEVQAGDQLVGHTFTDFSDGAGWNGNCNIKGSQVKVNDVTTTTLYFDLGNVTSQSAADFELKTGAHAGDAIGGYTSASAYAADLQSLPLPIGTSQYISGCEVGVDEAVAGDVGAPVGDLHFIVSATSTTAQDAAPTAGTTILDTGGTLALAGSARQDAGDVSKTGALRYLYICSGTTAVGSPTAGKFKLVIKSEPTY